MSDAGWLALLIVTPLACATVLIVALVIAATIMDGRDRK